MRGISRLAWGTVNILVIPDTVLGVRVWAATTRTGGDRPQPAREFVARFVPHDVAEYVQRARAVLAEERPAPQDSALQLSAAVLDVDTATLAIRRQRHRDRWDTEILMYLTPSDGAHPLVIRGNTRLASAFTDALLRAADSSRLQDPPADSSGPVVDANPADRSRCPRLLSGGERLQYPEEGILRRRGGEVWVSYVVGVDGRVSRRSLQVLLADADPFVFAVQDLLPYLRFAPALVAGVPVQARVYQRITFTGRM